MKTPIAIYNLWHQGPKTLVSIGGVAFALLLVFMQLGFQGAVSYTATNVLEKLEFDILLRPSGYLHLYEASTFDREWLDIARNTPGVEDARPFWMIIHNWRKLPNQTELESSSFERQFLPIALMAFDTSQPVFRDDPDREGWDVVLSATNMRDYGATMCYSWIRRLDLITAPGTEASLPFRSSHLMPRR